MTEITISPDKPGAEVKTIDPCDALKNQTPPPIPDWKYSLITLFEFRRRYFDMDSRPAKKRIEEWILSGTCEGVRLKARLMDGKYYIMILDAEKFLNSCKVSTPRDPRGPAERARDAVAYQSYTLRARNEAAKASLRQMGVKYL